MRSAIVGYHHRFARMDDLPAMRALMDRAINVLQGAFLDPDQVAASRAIMGLDTQLVEDGTYFVVEHEGRLAGCGGWSRRAPHFLGAMRPPGAIRRCSIRCATLPGCGRCKPSRARHGAGWDGSFSACARTRRAMRVFGGPS
jgi:hypothetical protein